MQKQKQINMFNLFTKKQTDKVVVAEIKDNFKPKTTNEIIEEIHETFYTEVERLLTSAKISNSLDTDKQFLIEKCARLKALGFTNTKEVKEAETEILRLDNLKKDNETKKTLIEAINYFSLKYPHYKFITEESVKKICEKYNLVYGEIDRYIGTVPDKNLKHIEDFKIHEDDECYVYKSWYFNIHIGKHDEFIKYKTSQEYKKEIKLKNNGAELFGVSGFSKTEINQKCPLEIVAPLKDFNMTNMEIKDFKLSKVEIPDPIVLKPVIFNNQKHYLIVTAWGLEAADELIINPNHN